MSEILRRAVSRALETLGDVADESTGRWDEAVRAVWVDIDNLIACEIADLRFDLAAVTERAEKAERERDDLLGALREVVQASNGVRVPFDTGKDTPDEELWGALLRARVLMAKIEGGHHG